MSSLSSTVNLIDEMRGTATVPLIDDDNYAGCESAIWRDGEDAYLSTSARMSISQRDRRVSSANGRTNSAGGGRETVFTTVNGSHTYRRNHETSSGEETLGRPLLTSNKNTIQNQGMSRNGPTSAWEAKSTKTSNNKTLADNGNMTISKKKENRIGYREQRNHPPQSTSNRKQPPPPFDTRSVVLDTSRNIGDYQISHHVNSSNISSRQRNKVKTSPVSKAPHGINGIKTMNSRTSTNGGRALRAKRDTERGESGVLHGASISLEKQIKSLEDRLAMSQSIMKKLYYRNVELDKEKQILQAELNSKSGESLLSNRDHTSDNNNLTQPTATTTVTLRAAFDERGRTIDSLRAANSILQKRVHVLESNVSVLSVKTKKIISMKQSLRETLAQSNMYMDQSRQIRKDYRRLLKMKADTFTKIAKSSLTGPSEEANSKITSTNGRPASRGGGNMYKSGTKASIPAHDRLKGQAGNNTAEAGAFSVVEKVSNDDHPKHNNNNMTLLKNSNSSTTSLVSSLRSQLEQEVREREAEGRVIVFSPSKKASKRVAKIVHSSLVLRQ